MSLPNRLTIFRVILVPVFVVFMLCDITEYDKWIALFIFVIASITDWLDGYIARKYNLVTNFGKFMDPLADKLLVCSAMICFIPPDYIPVWMVLIVIAREFIISGIRLVAADGGRVIAAGILGKIKTAVSMVMIIFVIADIDNPLYHAFTTVLIWVSLIFTVLSLIDYIFKNKDIFADGDNLSISK